MLFDEFRIIWTLGLLPLIIWDTGRNLILATGPKEPFQFAQSCHFWRRSAGRTAIPNKVELCVEFCTNFGSIKLYWIRRESMRSLDEVWNISWSRGNELRSSSQQDTCQEMNWRLETGTMSFHWGKWHQTDTGRVGAYWTATITRWQAKEQMWQPGCSWMTAQPYVTTETKGGVFAWNKINIRSELY